MQYIGSEIEASQALNNLTNLYVETECPKLDIDQFIYSLDSISKRVKKQSVDSWFIDYYVVEFLLASSRAREAKDRLEQMSVNGIEKGSKDARTFRS